MRQFRSDGRRPVGINNPPIVFDLPGTRECSRRQDVSEINFWSPVPARLNGTGSPTFCYTAS